MYLNTGIVIHVARNCVVDKPLHLEWSVSTEQQEFALHPRVVVVLEENAELSLVENFVGSTESNYLNNTVSEMAGETSAKRKIHQ